MPKKLRQRGSFGRYRLEQKLWEGTFAETWRANDGEQIVAIQVLRDTNIIQQLADSSPIPVVEHEGIARLIERKTDDKAFIWEFVPGRKLYTFIRELQQIKTNIAVYISRKMLEAMDFAEANEYAHGGIRPTRIIITPEKKVKLTNFGIGQLEQPLLGKLRQGQQLPRGVDEILAYFPPEILQGAPADNPKTDIYAIGVILSEMLTGVRASGSEIPRILYEKQIQKRIVSIITKAVADFDHRYSHPNEMHHDLTYLLKATHEVDKIYVPPPRGSKLAKNVALEAVPADSEEYRIYQADQIAARQTIDAEVVVAEPADFDEEGMAESSETKQKVARFDPDSMLMISTFSNKILDPLNMEPIWPRVFLRYGAVSLLILSALLILSSFYPLTGEAVAKDTATANWLMLPFSTLTQWSDVVQKIVYISLTILFLGLSSIPFWDRRGQFVLNSFFIPFISTLVCGLIGLGLWRQVEQEDNWISGRAVFVICLVVGIVVGISMPYLAGLLRRQMGELSR